MKKFLFFILISSTCSLFGQETTTTSSISQVFEYGDPKIELARLEDKKLNLEARLDQLKSDPNADPAEISRVQGTINYLNAKIESLQKEILSIEYAENQGMPNQGSMSDEEYEQKLEEWKKQQQNNTANDDKIVKTTLTKEEFNRLPKERQNIILSMPERYTIID